MGHFRIKKPCRGQMVHEGERKVFPLALTATARLSFAAAGMIGGYGSLAPVDSFADGPGGRGVPGRRAAGHELARLISFFAGPPPVLGVSTFAV